MKAYKLTWQNKTGGESFSVVTKKYVINYELGKKSVPIVGKILVFDSLDNLYNLLEKSDIGLGINDTKIFYGEAENPKRIKKLCYFSGHFDLFWKEYKSKKGHEFSCTAPKGTIACDSFLPIRVI